MYEQVILLGRGKVLFSCAKILKKINMPFKIYSVDKIQKTTLLQLKCLIGQECLLKINKDKDELTSILMNEQKKTLIISAVNSFIIPRDILAKNNITAINFHNSFLPYHPGRYAEAWTIFEQDDFAGVTWHFVSEDVDAGKVIAQYKFAVSCGDTSLSLLLKQNNYAVKLIEDNILSIIEESCETSIQNRIDTKMHYSWERPNNGILDLNWNIKKISAFLRSYDYGPLNTLGKPQVILDGKCYTWGKYKIEKDISKMEYIKKFDDVLEIKKDEFKITLKSLVNL